MKHKDEKSPQEEMNEPQVTVENINPEDTAEPSAEPPAADAELEAARAALVEQQDSYIRLAAEYDNFRKRTQKEKEAIWGEVKAQTAAAFLPVYDNLERAVKQETEDAAYAKGVQMTFDQLKEIFTRLGIEEIPALGETFDPERHNAVMHIEREDLCKSVVAEVYQTGFKLGEKIIRHAVVVVAN